VRSLVLDFTQTPLVLLCRRYEVLQRCGQVLKAPRGTPVGYRSADGFSVCWSKPDASIALHDVLLLNAGYPKTSANISMRLPVRSRVASMMLRS
jgi:hypothetical protein